MRFGFHLFMVDPAEFLDIARTADEWGWDSIQVADAPFFPEATTAPYPYTPDGERFFFVSYRPYETGDPQPAEDEDIFMMERLAAGWSEPQRLGPPVNSDQPEFFPSVARDGSLYFTQEGPGGGVGRISPDGQVSAIAVEPGNSQSVLVGTTDGAVFRSDQALQSGPTTEWASSRPRGGFVTSLAFDPSSPGVVYATFAEFGGRHVWRSEDGGRAWVSIDGEGEAAAGGHVPVVAGRAAAAGGPRLRTPPASGMPVRFPA